MPSFRMHLRARGKVAQVFKILSDAPQHPVSEILFIPATSEKLLLFVAYFVLGGDVTKLHSEGWEQGVFFYSSFNHEP